MNRVETIGRATLYLGDCRDILPTLGRVDAVVTDPPYFLPAVHYNTRKNFPRSLTDLGILEHYFEGFFGEVAEAIGETGTCYVFCDGQSYPAFYATAYRHFKKLRPLIWDKVSAFNGYSWRHQHELILFMEAVKTPPVPTGDGDILRFRAVKVDDREHPAEKPPELLAALIEKSVPAGGLVCDPFMGAGTCGVAAGNTGRRFVGIEREPVYNLMVYMLVGYDPRETWERIWHRYTRMMERKVRPYPMVHNRFQFEKPDLYRKLKLFQRWVITGIHKISAFEDFRPNHQAPSPRGELFDVLEAA